MAETKVKDLGWRRIRKEMKLANTRHVAVGILAKDAKDPTDTAASLLEVATWNHFGTGTIPARPFIVGAMEAHGTSIKKLQRRLWKGVSEGKLTTQAALEILGVKARDISVKSINDREYEPNADRTVASKGSSTPLVDTGQLKGAIAFEVR